jgi:hypothetical protein
MCTLQDFAQNIWTVEGPIVWDMGLEFQTRMAIVKLSDAAVWVSSPVPAPFETLRSITELGPVRYLIAATPRHIWRLDSWHTLFPEAELWMARPTAVTLKKANLPITGILNNTPPSAWANEMEQLVFKGNPLLSEVLFYHRQARTVLLDDLIQSNPPLEGRTFRNAVFKFAGGLAPQAGVGRDMRWTFFDRDLARQSLQRLLSWDFDKVIIAHGACVESDAKQYIKEAFRWLVKS